MAKSTQVLLLSSLGILLLAIQVRSQTPPAQKPAFEVASVKPNGSGNTTSAAFINGRFIATNAPLKVLLGLGYVSARGTPFYQIIGGPGWIDKEGFDVDAKTVDSHPIAVEQARLMIQSMLEDRFRLKVHSEMREVPVYNLVLAKDSPRMKLSEDQTPLAVEGTTQPGVLWDQSGTPPRGTYKITSSPSPSVGLNLATMGKALSASSLVNLVQRFVGRPVIDGTGLKGLFDVELHFTPETRSAAASPSPTGAEDIPLPDTSGVSISTALQEQLGLKLESGKGPVEVLVIDSVVKPSEN